MLSKVNDFFHNNRYVAWLIYAVIAILYFVNPQWDAFFVLAGCTAGMVWLYKDKLSALVAKCRAKPNGMRNLGIGVLVVLAVFGLLTGASLQNVARKDADHQQRVAAQQKQQQTSSDYAYRSAMGTLPGLNSNTSSRSSYSAVPSKTPCFACDSSGICSLCNGSGEYHNYGQTTDCSCVGGRCSTCGGKGWF